MIPPSELIHISHFYFIHNYVEYSQLYYQSFFVIFVYSLFRVHFHCLFVLHSYSYFHCVIVVVVMIEHFIHPFYLCFIIYSIVFVSHCILTIDSTSCFIAVFMPILILRLILLLQSKVFNCWIFLVSFCFVLDFGAPGGEEDWSSLLIYFSISYFSSLFFSYQMIHHLMAHDSLPLLQLHFSQPSTFTIFSSFTS